MSKCVICGKEIVDTTLIPFCSRRCKYVDLGRWFSESYVIPERENEKNLEDTENLSGQRHEISLYDMTESPDSSVGRAED